MQILSLLAIGLLAGVFAGMFGIGGGLLIGPALIYLKKMNELDAIGTSLTALIPPVGLLGAMQYYRAGHVNVKFAMLISAGLLVGALFGAKIMIGLPPATARKAYGVFLLIISARMLLFGK